LAMGIFRGLFGRKREQVVEDPRYGVMRSSRLNGEATNWAGKWELEAGELEFFIQGNEQGPSEASLITLEKIFSDRQVLDAARNSVIDTLRNADPDYPADRFDADMELVAITVNGAAYFEINYCQRQDPFYHFNAIFENGAAAGVSVDS
jgi:hypothetical protein